MKTENISMEKAKELFNTGVFKTILETDTRYSEHRPIVVLFVSNGNKYIHGIVCHKDENGKVEPNYWVAKFDKANCKILDGARWDLIEQHRQYESAKFAYRERRERAEREADYEAHQEAAAKVSVKMEQWSKENPEPENPFNKKVLTQ